uniref:Uncharacterized protein n=1 Tax=Ditylenchus dipsaci TaxID=166011 RepID=A0A915CWD4_9BILA
MERKKQQDAQAQRILAELLEIEQRELDEISSSEFFIRKVIIEQSKGESNLTALIMQGKIQLKAYAEANSRVPERRREPISKDVALLQLAPSTPEFVNAAKLLEQEWDAKYAGQPRVIEVCRYFPRF